MEVSSAPAVGSAAASPRMERSSIFPKREQLLRGAGNSCERDQCTGQKRLHGQGTKPSLPPVAVAVPGGDLDFVAVRIVEEH